jgi:UrcA family protein
MTRQYTLATVVALALVSTPALSQPVRNDDEAPRMAVVTYADLNLNTAQGHAILVARIRQAAVNVCGPEPDSRDLKRLPSFRQCITQTVNTAVTGIPSVSQVAGSAKPAG